MEWTNIPENINEWFGFVYKITNIKTGVFYIGKKQFFSKKTLKPLMGKKRKRKTFVQSDWKSYYGSSEQLKKDVISFGEINFKREILELTTCKWESAYIELLWQMKEKVLLRNDTYNGIIHVRIGKTPKHLSEKYNN